MDISSDFLNQFNQLTSSGMISDLENLKKENKELERIVSDISQLISYTNVDSMLDYIVSKFLDYFIPEKLIFLIHPPRKTNLRQYYFDALIRQEEELSEKIFEKIIEQINAFGDKVETGSVIDFNEIDTKDDVIFNSEFKKLKIQYIIPLKGIGGAYGFVLMSGKITGKKYSQTEITYIKRIFSVLAITIQNGLHYESSIKDPKTGLFTYEFFESRIKESISSCQRYKRNAGMLMIDIDFFKKFNDTWGHLTGDKVLIALAECLKKTVRTDDVVARFGGEEFSVLLTQCTPESIIVVAERIRKAVSCLEIEEHGEKLHVTISVGGCLIDDISGLTPKIIFRKADAALYHSKENGRNQSTVYSLGFLDRAKLKNSMYAEHDEDE